ncbi:MAG: PilC/PilY family type IV pilus protein [Burkholderiaceae bacterium]
MTASAISLLVHHGLAPATRRRLALAVLLAGVWAAHPAAGFEIAQVPPFLRATVDPNIVVTFDDSGSMSWAFVPDSLDIDERLRRFKSSRYNALYYDPEVQYPIPLGPNGQPIAAAPAFGAAPINGFRAHKFGGQAVTVDLYNGYRPTLAYDPSSMMQSFAEHTSADLELIKAEWKRRRDGKDGIFLTITPGPAYYYRYKTNTAGCTDSTNENCYTLVFVSKNSGVDGSDERQNFANWYSFYRTRNLLTVAAAANAFQRMPDRARVAWQALNSCADDNFSGPCGSVNVKHHIRQWVRTSDNDASHRDNFYRWLFNLPASGGTPLQAAAARAGKYFISTSDDGPYGLDPNQSPPVKTVGGAAKQLACRPNFHLMLTDGIWNSVLNSTNNRNCTDSSGNLVLCGDKDRTDITLPGASYQYRDSSLTKIYRGQGTNNMADIAFHYWATDLRPDLGNKLLPYMPDTSSQDAEVNFWNPKNDPATWQHLTTFTVGLGLSNTLVGSAANPPWAGSTFAGAGYADLRAGTKTWPDTGESVSPGNVYDLWHAAINSRGQFFSAEKPGDLAQAFATALYRIDTQDTASAALVANSTRLQTNNLLFQAKFDSGDWTGQLIAYAMQDSGEPGAIQWNTRTTTFNAKKRKIFTHNGSTGIPFERKALKDADLWTAGYSNKVLAYLSGDQSQEDDADGLRQRASILGDIINSDPVFVANESFGYTSLPEGRNAASRYDDFIRDQKKCVRTTVENGIRTCVSRTPMLYVGANDGMLHAFNALTGEEKFAYIPNALLGDLPLLAAPDYSHRYYVDGSPTAWDAFIDRRWRSVVLGSTGAGGKSVFALDVTDPERFDADKVLWEINATSGPEFSNDLGYTIGQGTIAKLNDKSWVAVFGNGYRSNHNKAVLYIVDLATGKLIKKIDTGIGSANAHNGLGTVSLHDRNGDDVYDSVYAADMLGNVWKFDLSDADPARWGVAFDGKPLFTATSADGKPQPIQGTIELIRPPATVGQPGDVMLLFGTGRFFATTDRADLTRQSFYGILDSGTRITATGRSALQEQTIETLKINLRGAADTHVRKLSANPVAWNSGKRGWYIDFRARDTSASPPVYTPDEGERVIGAPVLKAGRVIFTTMIPSSDACDFGGSGWLMEFDARTGQQLPTPLFDTNGDKLVNDKDTALAGLPITVGLTKQALAMDGPTAVKLMSGSSGKVQVERNLSFSQARGRDAWRQK